MVSSDFRTHGFIRSSFSFPTIHSPSISAIRTLHLSIDIRLVHRPRAEGRRILERTAVRGGAVGWVGGGGVVYWVQVGVLRDDSDRVRTGRLPYGVLRGPPHLTSPPPRARAARPQEAWAAYCPALYIQQPALNVHCPGLYVRTGHLPYGPAAPAPPYMYTYMYGAKIMVSLVQLKFLGPFVIRFSWRLRR
jgi:hypothetical protein